VNATVEHDDLDDTGSNDYGYHGLNFDDCETGDDAHDIIMPAAARVTTMAADVSFSGKSNLFQSTTTTPSAIVAESSGSSSDDDDGGDCNINDKIRNDTMFIMFANKKSSTSTDDLSDYLSCHDGPSSSLSLSLLDLQESFQEKAYLSTAVTALTSIDQAHQYQVSGRKQPFVIPSEEEDDQKTVMTTTTAAVTSTKRKRLSQHYLTPKSSYSSFTNGPWLYQHPSSAPEASLFAINHQQHHQEHHQEPCSILPTLPQENLVLIASYLTVGEVHTLSTSCRAIRAILMTSQGATTDIWMKRMRQVFPSVFCRITPDNLKNTAAMNNANNDRKSTSVADGLDVELARMRRSFNATARFTHGSTNSQEMEQVVQYTKTNVSSQEVTFVDDYQLPIPGLLEDTSINNCSSTGFHATGDYTSATNKVNLPLLTGLLPSRYPQTIDPLTLVANLGRRFGQRRIDGRSSDAVFRSYTLEIDVNNAIIASQQEDNEGITLHTNNMVQGDTAARVQVVPVVQLLGNVGRGDRCIRSDMPFPPNCREVTSCTGCNRSCHCNSNNSARARNNESSSAVSFGGLSLSWMKSRSSHRSRQRRSRQNRSSRSSRMNGNIGDVAAHSSTVPSHAVAAFRASSSLSSIMSTGAHPAGFNMPYPSTPAVYSAPSIMPSQHSPLYRFLSCLSHHCASPASSSIDDNSMRSSYLDERRCSSNTSEQGHATSDDGLNNHGIISTKHGLMSKCKQCLGIGKLRHNGSGARLNYDNLRPFVVPTVISDTRNIGAVSNEGGRLVVDVTPRLVAYFEVTIVKKQGHGDSLESQREHENRPNLRLRHNNRRRLMLQRAVFMPMPFPLPLDAPIMALGGLEMNPFRAGGQRMPHAIHRPQQFHHADDNANQQQQQQRHECVAIGLSTKHFSPTNKMPGWDMESYGYHGDDGGIFHGQGDMLSPYGPAFGPGDTVGCGLEYFSRRIFFVKNGIFLGYAFDNDVGGGGGGGGGGLGKDVVESGLYPTVGVDTDCPIFTNFGEHPFKFDLKGFAAAVTSGNGVEGEKESS